MHQNPPSGLTTNVSKVDYSHVAEANPSGRSRNATADLPHSLGPAGISTFDLSRYLGASLAMTDRHFGLLAPDGRKHAIRLLDELRARAASVLGHRRRSGAR